MNFSVNPDLCCDVYLQALGRLADCLSNLMYRSYKRYHLVFKIAQQANRELMYVMVLELVHHVLY